MQVSFLANLGVQKFSRLYFLMPSLMVCHLLRKSLSTNSPQKVCLGLCECINRSNVAFRRLRVILVYDSSECLASSVKNNNNKCNKRRHCYIVTISLHYARFSISRATGSCQHRTMSDDPDECLSHRAHVLKCLHTGHINPLSSVSSALLYYIG